MPDESSELLDESFGLQDIKINKRPIKAILIISIFFVTNQLE